MNRDALLLKLLSRSAVKWDIIVIGGGATGLGIAFDAASRGYKTLLLEQSDFAKGTSSRSTKLVHGGVRYLAQGDIVLVMEALHERGRMLKNAPHLTFNQEFVIPIYTWWNAFVYTAGLKIYDLMAGTLSLGKSHFISRNTTLKRLPLIQPEGLKGGVVYHDGQFDDARLAITLAQSCVEKGGVTLNYFKVFDLLKNDKGKIEGVKAKDLKTGNEYDLKANAVINATGVFADDILRMDDPVAIPTIRPSQGVHLVLDNSFLQSRSAIMIPKTDDGRVLFAIPWYGKVVVGTTDTPVNLISVEPKALKEEIDFILNNAGRYLTRPPKNEDILCIFAGLRPLAVNSGDPTATKEISRRHKITVSSSGLITIIGGKWTIYRRMAQDTINKAIKKGLIDNRPCISRDLRLYGSDNHDLPDRLNIYGHHAADIKKMIDDKPESGEPIHAEFPYCRAEIIWICNNEMPNTIEDILARRTRSLLLNAKASEEIAPEIADIMIKELGFDATWKERQLEEYHQLLKNYLLP